MENDFYNVEIGDEVKSYPAGITYGEIVKEYQKDYENDIVLVFVGERLQELHKTLKKDCVLRFVTTGDQLGFNAYKRSMCFMMVKAIYDVAGHDQVERVRILYAIDQGYYCTIEGEYSLTEDFLNRVESRMQMLVDADLPIKKRAIGTDEAISLFRQYGMYDKEKLFKYRRVSKVNMYSMNEFEDYYYGYMVPSAGYLRYFRLQMYKGGFILQLPDVSAPTVLPPIKYQHKLFNVMKESTSWGDKLGIKSVGDLNECITRGDMLETVLVQEAMQEKKIADIAQMIAEKPEVRFILIAGPSSSGKTTFSHRLSIQLRANGKIPHPIAVDNYFVERDETPVDENGELDFECLEAVDVELFNQQMKDLLAGNEVVIPQFNFISGHKEYLDPPMKLGKHDVLVIEGIHCLNPKLTESLCDENTFKIYISALTQLNVDEHNRIPTTDGRLIRRIVRDARTRGASAERTIRMWPAVRRGEEKNIFPYQEEADLMFNSALIYELAVLKPYAEAQLFSIDRESPEYLEAKRLLKFLDYFVGIGSENIPTNSLLREFVGSGCFRV